MPAVTRQRLRHRGPGGLHPHKGSGPLDAFGVSNSTLAMCPLQLFGPPTC